MRRPTLFLIALLASLNPPVRGAVVMSAGIHWHAVIGEEDQRETLVLFADERPRLELVLEFSPLRLGRNEVSRGERVLLPAADWTKYLSLTVTDQDGTITRIDNRDLSVLASWTSRDGAAPAGPPAIHDDEVLHAKLELPPLRVGECWLGVALDLPPQEEQAAVHIEAPSQQIIVRQGDETLPVHRAYLRATADRIAATPAPDRYDRFIALMLELARLEPTNPYVYERLGDISVGTAPIDETLGYYTRAQQLIDEDLVRRFGDSVPAREKADAEKRRRALGVFSRALAEYKAAGPGARMGVYDDRSGKHVIIFRADQTRTTID